MRGLLGVVHLPPLPGDPGYRQGGVSAVEEWALTDARALRAGGADGVLVENFGSAPFVKGSRGDRLPPHAVAAMARVCRAVKREVGGPVGVNCLRNDARAAIGIAAAAELDFVRVNVHIGAYVTDQGVIEGEAADTLRYRATLGAAHVKILADVLVKHAAPLAPADMRTAVRETLGRGMADAVIVTGDRTGGAVDRASLEEARDAAGGACVLIGSGLTVENAPDLTSWAEGAIVGTAVKRGGDVREPVDETRVRELRAACRFRRA